MRLTYAVLAIALVASSVANVLPFEARDVEVPDDREHCLLKDAQNHAGECTSQAAQHCWDGGGDCTYNAKTKRCSNGTNMRGTSAPIACLSCQCSAR
ncbi:hypothetical protein GGG16DRAFT_121799 [Schizophyllum commune]